MTIQELLEQAKAGGAEARVLTDGITFVDATNATDPVQDGTAKHPFASIAQAVERAGESGVIFVNGGEYDEEVVLKPGQTLTSEIDLQGGERYASVEAPLIRPGANTLSRTYQYNKYIESGRNAAVWLCEGNVLRRVRVEAGDGDSVYAHVSGEHGDATLVIAQCLLPQCVVIQLEAGALGKLEFIDNGSLERGEGLPDEEPYETNALGQVEIKGEPGFRLGRLLVTRNKVGWGEQKIAFSGTLGALEVTDNSIVGEDGYGTRLEISLLGDASVEDIRLANNSVAYRGSKDYYGLSLELYGKVDRAALEGNSFLGGDEASGVYIQVRGQLGELRVADNSIETNTYFPENDVEVLNIYIDEDTQLGSCLVVDNHVTLYGDYGDEDDEDDEDDEEVEHGERVAVLVQLEPGASVDSLEIAGNAIDLPDDDCVDVLISGEPGQIGRKTVRDNRVSREKGEA